MGLLLGEKIKHVWHIRVQLWHRSGRKRRQAYRVIANSEQNAIKALLPRLPTLKGRVVTRCVEGREV